MNQPNEAPAWEEAALERLKQGREDLLGEIRRVIIGQEDVVEQLLIVLFAGSHALVTGAPGLAKTRLVRTVAQILDLQFKRIQFTPDLMPSDIVGTEILDEDRTTGHREMRFVAGPVFTNILLADEINRTPPKTQAALLEAMEEKQVSQGGDVRPLPKPFYVFATQNPIELEGTYPLPEAQLDRFMFNIQIRYLNEEDELRVATMTTAEQSSELKQVFQAEDLIAFARLVRQVPVAEPIARYAVRVVMASRPGQDGTPDFVNDWVGWGAGTRGSQNLLLAAKSRALLRGRYHVSLDDIRQVAPSVLRHRVLLNFRAEADRVQIDDVIQRLLDHIPQPDDSLTL